MTDELDTLRPEVRDALFSVGKRCDAQTFDTLSAELLRLAEDATMFAHAVSLGQRYKQRAETAEAELAALKARAQWQPIETAPHDGNRVLLWNRDWAAPFAGQFYGEAAGGWRLDYRIAPFTHQPTHWMPLPPAPAEQGEG